MANLYNKPLVEAMSQANAAVRDIGLLPGYSTSHFGQGKFIGEAAVKFLLALILSPAFTGQSLTLNSVIGLFLLMGVLNKKNSILQVDYTNTRRERGMERFQANHARLRPILMTTLSIVFGMFPIASGRGDGAAGRSSMARVVIGGQMLSLFLTLAATPVFYSLFDELGTPRLVRSLAKAPAAAWNRFTWGWRRPATGRRSPSQAHPLPQPRGPWRRRS